MEKRPGVEEEGKGLGERENEGVCLAEFVVCVIRSKYYFSL